MAYSDAISNAIAARGNALAQSAAQQGQVYGNLASNLGQLPFQAMQAGQRRRALEVETQHRAAQTQTIQDELDFQKEMSAAISGPGTPEEIDQRAEQVLKKRPAKWLQYQELVGRHKERDRQFELERVSKEFAMRSGQPGTEFERPITPPAAGNAFAPGQMQPQIPVPQRQMEFETMVHPMNALGVRPPTDVDRQRADQAASEIDLKRQQTLQRSGIEGQKEVAKFTAGLKSDKPLTAADTDVRMEGGVPVTYQFNPATQRFDIRVGEARPQSAMGMGLGMPQFVGTQAGQAVVFQPTRGGAGKMATVPLPGEGSLRPRTVGTGEVKATSDIEASEQKIVNLKTMYNKDWVGPAQGRWNDWMMKVPGVSVDPKMAKFYAANTALENEVIKFITGAQMSEPESQRILRQVPTFRDKPEVWEAKYDQTLENVRIMKQKMAEAGVMFGESPAAPSAPAAGGETKIINGVTYQKVQGGWQKQKR